jgi:hypothetical protein
VAVVVVVVFVTAAVLVAVVLSNPHRQLKNKICNPAASVDSSDAAFCFRPVVGPLNVENRNRYDLIAVTK